MNESKAFMLRYFILSKLMNKIVQKSSILSHLQMFAEKLFVLNIIFLFLHVLIYKPVFCSMMKFYLAIKFLDFFVRKFHKKFMKVKFDQ